nr:MAG TPA: hypothetical protein [Caudoviricetes sp.]
MINKLQPHEIISRKEKEMKDWEPSLYTKLPSGLIIDENQIKKAEHAISSALKTVLEDENQTYEVIRYILVEYVERLESKKVRL